MTDTPFLAVTLLSASQNNKYLTVNDAVANLELATQKVLVVDFTTGNQVLSEAQFTRNAVFRCTALDASRLLTIPTEIAGNPVNRVFIVDNTSAFVVSVTDGTASADVPADSTALLYYDDVNLRSVSGSGGGGSSGPQTLTENPQTGTTYTAVLTDADDVFISVSNASSNVVTIPANADVALPIGAILYVQQKGAGSTSIAPFAGVTIVKPSSLTLVLREQWSWCQLVKTATDTWSLVGDMIGSTGALADANDISYDNGTSGLSATDVQAAIDEIVAGLGTASAQDHETGTFTPLFSYSTVGTSSWSYAEQTGSYVKIGSMCSWSMDLAATPTLGTGTGVVSVSLPFTADLAVGGTTVAPFSLYTTVAWPTGATQLQAQIFDGQSSMALYGAGSGINPAPLTQTTFPNAVAVRIRAGGNYQTT